MSTQTTRHSVMSGDSRRRTVLKDNSWIRRNPEEDESVGHEPSSVRVVLGQVKAVDAEGDGKTEEADQSPGNSGTSVSSLTKRFGGGQELMDRSSNVWNSRSAAAQCPPVSSKPPVPTRSPALQTSPSSSSFTARVFSANTSSKALSPVKPSFGEKFPEVTASQSTNGLERSSAGPTPPAAVTITSSSSSSSSSSPSSTSTSVRITTPVRSEIRSERVSVSSSSPSTAATSALDATAASSPAEKPSASTEKRISSRDLCTVCEKPIAGGERMILEELKINSHASCFRCAVCHCDLGGLDAGMSLWVHRERVNCSNCYSEIRGQWYI